MDMLNKYTGKAMTVERITPEIAKEILFKSDKTDYRNRNLVRSRIAHYAALMKSNHWRLNGETIQIGIDGEVINGQHRLHACIEAGVPFETYVVWGLPRDVFSTIDRGKIRTPANALQMVGAHYTNQLASAMRIRKAIVNDVPLNNVSIDADEALEIWAEEGPAFNDACMQTQASFRGLIPGGVAAAMYVLFAEKDPTWAQIFFERLASGANLEEDDPIFVLRERLLKLNREVAGQSSIHVVAIKLMILIIRGWNASREGRKISSIHGTRPEDRTYPEILG